MMATGRSSYVCFMVLALLCATALAAPCIECKDCKGSDYCLSKCARSCPKPQPTVNGEQCKWFGYNAAWKAAKEACETSLLFCRGGVKQQAFVTTAFFPVSLSQCANIAVGTCEEGALDPWRSPCGYALIKGVDQCNREAFKKFYTGEVTSRCNQAVKWIDEKAARGQ